MSRVGIIDIGSGNIRSLAAAIIRTGHVPVRVARPEQMDDDIGQLIIPGQGRFATVMKGLNENGWTPLLKNWITNNKPLIGICVGFQILFEESEEDPGVAGLGIFKGQIKRMTARKLPMMGWSFLQHQTITDNAEDCVYFVNSYAAPLVPETIATMRYGERYSAIVRKGNTVASQFHPEKSGQTGTRILQQWLC